MKAESKLSLSYRKEEFAIITNTPQGFLVQEKQSCCAGPSLELGRREGQQLPLGETLCVCGWVCVLTQDNFLLCTKTVFVTSTHVRSRLLYITL